MSIAEAKLKPFTYEAAVRDEFVPGMPILSVIVDCYYGLDLVEQSIQSVLDQDYPNVELLLVDNGAEPAVGEYLRHVHLTEPNAPLITFAENQFSWNDTEMPVAVCWNAALIHATGEYVTHLSYDDMLSPNYAGQMLGLFGENPNCVTAAPLPVSIDEFGHRNEVFNAAMVNGNTRGKYTPGTTLAFDLIQGHPNRLFAAPGEIFVIRKSELLQYGGFDRLCDVSQVLKYAILGESGFDPEAQLLWRHHSAQANKQARDRGFIRHADIKAWWESSGIVPMWRARFDNDQVAALIAFRDKGLNEGPIAILRGNIRLGKMQAAALALVNFVRECPHLLPRALRVAAAELAMLLPRACYRAIRLAAVKLLPASTVAAARSRRGAKV